MARGIEPLFEPAMPPVLPLDDTIEKFLFHKVLPEVLPDFDYLIQTYKASYPQCFNAIGTLWFCSVSWSRTKYFRGNLPGELCVSSDLQPTIKRHCNST